jgi:hypothetical protein
MARKIIKDTAYTFNPSTRTLVIPRVVPQERMILITNVTKNKVIYNFSDSSLLATSYTSAYDSSMNETTTIVLNYNTSAMSPSDKIQVTIDEWDERFVPAETQLDPTNKLRVSQPQSLIDTDFEYGTQISKWENLTMINNRPLASQSSAILPFITDVQIQPGFKTVTVFFSQAHNLSVGTPITVLDPYLTFCAGNFIIETTPTTAYSASSIASTGTTVTYTVPSTTGIVAGSQIVVSGASTAGFNGTFTVASVTGTTIVVNSNVTGSTSTATVILSATTLTYTARSTNTTTLTSVFDPYKTSIYSGNFYTNSAIGNAAPVSVTYLNGFVTVQTTVPHDLSLGNEVALSGLTAANSATATVTAASGSGALVTYTTSAAHGFIVGQYVTTTGSSIPGYNLTGAQIASVPTTTTFTVINPTTGVATVTSGTAIANYAPNGAFVVSGITNNSTFSFYSAIAPTGTIGYSSAYVYARPQGQFLHRAFDGGVLFSSNGSSNMEQAVRQTRRYFRYQAGKGVQMSSGTTLKPYAGIDNLTSSGTTVTVQTKERHNIQPGTSILISGANETAYNGTFAVTNVLSYNQFQYTALSVPTNPVASGLPQCAVVGWYGATNRLGIFDQQNGLFWEYDGQGVYVVRRNSTTQIAGKVTVTLGSNTVTQTSSSFPTYFSKQVAVGQYVVIRGQSYRVTEIASDTSLTISPSYRGSTSNYAVISLTNDLRIPQSQFNIDKIDGTGPSGYNIDLSKMQMFYVDYTWYGAGFVRWGVRGPKGDIIYVHRMPNNNVNTLAYMRAGNLPGRYETQTTPYTTNITSSVGSTDTTINVASTSGFPTNGTICIRNASQYEYINYTGTTSTSFTGCTRAQAGNTSGLALTIASGSNIATVSSATGLQVGQRVYGAGISDGTFISAISGLTVTLSIAVTANNPTAIFAPMASTAQAFTYAATAPILVEFAYPTFAPSLSHWGTSAIMDGRFDDDKSLLFTYGQISQTSLAGTSSTTTTVTGSSGSNQITVGSSANLVTGMTVSGTGISPTAVVTGINGNTITMSVNNLAAVSGNGTFTGGTTKALLSARIAPSVDNGIAAAFGQRELINRIQMVLRALDVTLNNTNNVLVSLILNGVVTSQTAWTNAIGNQPGRTNSSLSQIADYAGGYTNINGGEATAGFFTNSTTSLDLSLVRDLGNAILGGGTSPYSNATIYPDGPDVITIVVTNLSSTPTQVATRLSWTEAQA